MMRIGCNGFGSLVLLCLLIVIGRAGAAPSPQVEGRFGKGYQANAAAEDFQVEVAGREAYRTPPLTVECWAKLNEQGKNSFNILVANESKDSMTHWELYTCAGTGALSFYMPGAQPQDARSTREVCDGQWHCLAATVAPDRVRLFVDGQEVINVAVTQPAGLQGKPGALTIGRLPGDAMNLGCDGVIDEVRLSKVAREIAGVPAGPFAADEQTIGLWHFDDADTLSNGFADASMLGNPVKVTALAGRSLDEIEQESFAPLPGPLTGEATPVDLVKGPAEHVTGPTVVKLDGVWQMAAEGNRRERLTGEWPDALAAMVPGSVHAALVKAGKLPDPVVGKNQLLHREQSFKTWWMKTTFDGPKKNDASMGGPVWLRFDGVCSACEVWLNGESLGRHIGMFGGPAFEVGGLLRERNTLIVKLEPAGDWNKDVVFNNCYGWHYCQIPARGIWRSVWLEGAPAVKLNDPFAAATDAKAGKIKLALTLAGASRGWSGRLVGTIEPDNFTGEPYHFEQAIKGAGQQKMLLGFTVPEPKLWWPNGLGEQNLYRIKLSFVPDGGGVADHWELPLGIRTVAMAPLPKGKYINKYNWTFVINGEPHFIKGNGWCTMDPLMNFSRERYDRFLSLAQAQHVQMLRAWGSGMPETDDFYDLCDRKGIMIMQEWPTAWDSHLTQPYDALEETIRLNTIRTRNHPALALYTGGNEVPNPFGAAIDMMGRAATELDGTRVFHRTDPWGGSQHNYNCYWGDAPLDYNVTMKADFWGEFGLACMPALESVLKYLPDNEKTLWPAPEDGSLWHHTPIFNTANDHKHLALYSKMFMPDDTLAHFIAGSQLAQATGLRHPLERARTRWPEATGALYYKMNDNFPAASWSCADWFGVAKISQYINMDAFAPLHACVVFESLNTPGQALSLPVFLLDDADALKGAAWEVTVRAYGADLKEIKRQAYPGNGSVKAVAKLGEFTLTAEQNQAAPLLTVVEVKKSGGLSGGQQVADRTFYWSNYEAKPGCLMQLPKTRVSMKAGQGERGPQLIVKNEGAVPAVGVNFPCPEVSDRFLADDGYFWLDAGEEKVVNVNLTDKVGVAAWNADEVK